MREAPGAVSGNGGLHAFMRYLLRLPAILGFVLAVTARPVSAMFPSFSLFGEDPQGTFQEHIDSTGVTAPVQIPARGQLVAITQDVFGNTSVMVLHMQSQAFMRGIGKFTVISNGLGFTQSFGPGGWLGLGVLGTFGNAYNAAGVNQGSVWIFQPQATAYVLADGRIGFVLGRRIVFTNGGYSQITIVALTMRGPDFLTKAKK